MTALFASEIVETSNNLTLSLLRPEHAEIVQAITDHPAITSAISILHSPFTLEDTKALIRNNEGGEMFILGMWRRSDAALVGISVFVLHGEDEVELGQWVGAAYHNGGYGTEAAAALTRLVRRIMPGRTVFVECDPLNRPSWKVLERVGYRSTGKIGNRPPRVRMLFTGEPALTASPPRSAMTGG